MRVYTAVVISWAAISFGISSANDSESIDGFIDHTGDWLVGITQGGIEVAEDIARKEKFNSVEEIPELKVYRLYNLDSKDKRHKDEITEKLQSYDAVQVAQPNIGKAYLLHNNWRDLTRSRSGYSFPMENNVPSFPTLFGDESIFTGTPSYGGGYVNIGQQIITTKPDPNAIYCAGQSKAVSTKREFYCKDPLSKKQWFMRSCEEILEGKPSPHGIKLIQTWEDFKVSGKGVVVLVVDSGIRTDHLDLDVDLNYSYDFVDNKNDPYPVDGEPHGTNCAGIIAMKRDNGICGTGVAPGVTLGGIRLLGKEGASTPFHDVKADIFKAKDVHIIVKAHSNDFSNTFKELEVCREGALKYGVEKGRNGKGIIYVIAAGNHKKEGKACSVDSSLNNLYVIVIGGVQNDGTPSKYAERCSNMFAVTYSGNGQPYTILTVTLGKNDQCDDNFNGTSASSPLAGGLLALVLEANPNLTWRDVKHLLVWTSEIAPLKPAGGFIKNARGLYPSLDFGFGLINVYDMVEQARNFKNVPPMHTCVIRHRVREDQQRWNGRSGRAFEFNTKSCDNTPQQVTYVEEVEARISLTFAVRGLLQIHLVSPSGTKVPLLEARPIDPQPADFTFTFGSVFTWGEIATGTWKLEFSDMSRDYNNTGTIKSIDFVIFGTKDEPEHYKKGNRKYFGLPDELK